MPYDGNYQGFNPNPADSQPAPPSQPPTPYGGTTAVPDETGQGKYSAPQMSAPAVPGTSVDTPSMELFARNIDQLVGPIESAINALSRVDVHAGIPRFYHANRLRTTINGANADAGLANSSKKVFADLKVGLADIRDAVTAMSEKYKNIEDANRLSAKDVENYMKDSDGAFTGMAKDGGGDGSGSSSSDSSTDSGAGPSSGAGGSTADT